MIRRRDLDDGLSAAGRYGVRVGASGVGAAAENCRLREELDAEASGGSVDTVHANSRRRGRTFLAAEHGLEKIGLHGLHADTRSF